MSTTITIDLEDDTRRALDRLAQQTGRPIDDLVNQAVRDYLQLQEWQRQKIEAGIAAAERGEFSTEDELMRIANKYSPPG
jgi:predicted transcriptional regulator